MRPSLIAIGLLLLLGTGCPPDGEGWDYRWGIRKDFEEQTKLNECPVGKHWKTDCPPGTPMSQCQRICQDDEPKK